MKKILTLCCMLLLPCAFFLTACGGSSKALAYTVDALPQGVQSVNFESGTVTGEGTFIPKGKDAKLRLSIHDNYEINTLKILINQQPIELVETATSNLYTYTLINPQEKFNISFTGETKEIQTTVTFKYERNEDVSFDREILKNYTIEFDASKINLGTTQGVWTLYDFANLMQDDKTMTNVNVTEEFKFTIYSTPIYQYKIRNSVIALENTDSTQSDYLHLDSKCENEKLVFTFQNIKHNLTVKFNELFLTSDEKFDFRVAHSPEGNSVSLSSFNDEYFKFTAASQNDFIKTTDAEKTLYIEMLQYDNVLLKSLYNDVTIKINGVDVNYELNANVMKITLAKPYTYSKYSSGYYMFFYDLKIDNFFENLPNVI